MDNSYEALDELLTIAASNLDTAAYVIRDLGFAPEVNVRRVGEALANVFEIQHALYAVRPDLQPDFLKKG